jgi:hypothetical protein
MKIKLLLFLSFVSANILADEYTGTISIAKRTKFRNYYEFTSIVHLPKKELSTNYPNYYAYISPDGCDVIIPDVEVENWNSSRETLYQKYHVMPRYMPALDISDEIYLMVVITLNDNNLFKKNTNCFLPLNVFEADEVFKKYGDEITLEQSFIDYKNEQINSVFKLTLDNSFNNIQEHYEEFLEDFEQPCHTKTGNCLARAWKKLRNKFKN